MHLSVEKNSFKLKKTFTISRGSRTCAEVLTVKIKDDDFIGWAECVPYKRYNESLETVTKKLQSIELPITIDHLQEKLKPGVKYPLQLISGVISYEMTKNMKQKATNDKKKTIDIEKE